MRPWESSDFQGEPAPSLGSGVGAYLATIVYGAVLIIVVMIASSGIRGWLGRAWPALRPRVVPAPAGEEAGG